MAMASNKIPTFIYCKISNQKTCEGFSSTLPSMTMGQSQCFLMHYQFRISEETQIKVSVLEFTISKYTKTDSYLKE